MKNSDLLEEEITHSLYGEGTIKSIENDYMSICFGDGEERKFSFPSCFERFIKLSDSGKQQEMENVVIKWKKENGVFEQEIIHNMTLATQAGIEKREKQRQINRIKKAREEASRNSAFFTRG